MSCLQLTPREYLETALHSVEGRGASVEAKNRVNTLFSCRLASKQEVFQLMKVCSLCLLILQA